MKEVINKSNALLESWVEGYSDDLFSWAYSKTNNIEIAKDLTQDTFLAAAKGIEKFKGESQAKTWLFSILNNKIADYHKKNFKKQSAGIIENEGLTPFFNEKGSWHKELKDPEWDDNETHLLDDSDFNDVLEKCMSDLPETWFSAISLKYNHSKNGDLICQELGISQSNYWQILHRAKLQLRSCLNLNWFNKTKMK